MLCTKCNDPVKPVVAQDIDGSLGQYHSHLLGFFSIHMDRTMPRNWDGSGNWEDYLGIDRKEYQDGKLAFRQGGFKRWMPPYPNAKEICQAVRANGAELWMTTTRPFLRLDSVDPDTREWLRRHKIEYDNLLYDDDKYGRLLELVGPDRVVAVVEDLPEQHERALELFGPDVAILLERNHNQWYRDNLKFGMTGHVVHGLREAAIIAIRNISEWQAAHA